MHAPHLLRGLGVAVIVSAVLALSACGISYDVTIHDDDTLDQTILIWDSGGVMGKSDCSAEGMGQRRHGPRRRGHHLHLHRP